MNVAADARGESQVRRLALIGLITVLYGAAYLSWYWETPLGRAPVLDGRENLQLAADIAQDSLAPEPFFRAMLYPAALAVFHGISYSEETQMLAVGMVGLLSHLVSTLLVGFMAGKIVGASRACLLAGLLYGLYPVSLYFAADPLDTVLSLTLFLAGLTLLIVNVPSEAGVASGSFPWRLTLATAGVGLFWALASLARPNFILNLAVAPLLVYWAAKNRSLDHAVTPRWRLLAALACCLGALTPLLSYACWQYHVSQHFGILPWQGAFSLWAANRIGANGKYYSQQVLLEYDGPYKNPAQIEAKHLFLQATGKSLPVDIPEMNRYWRSRTVREIMSDPISWLGLQGRKFYFFVNDFEQYNNKTFLFHKRRCPWLDWNPLGWGLIAVAGAAGWWPLQKRNRASARILGACFAVYWAGAMLFFASDRFRYPLVPLACLCSGALILWTPAAWRGLSRQTKTVTLGLPVAVAILAYSSWFDVRDTSTFLQDKLLLAHASLRSGQDEQAHQWALQVLQEDPARNDARQILAQATFNLDLLGSRTLTHRDDWRRLLKDLDQSNQTTPALNWIKGVALWKTGDTENALATWRRITDNSKGRAAADALALLILSGHASNSEKQTALIPEPDAQGPYLLLARLSLKDPIASNYARLNLKDEDLAFIQKRVQHLLSPVENRPATGQ